VRFLIGYFANNQ